MKKMTNLVMLALFLGTFMFGFNAYAGKSADWPGFAEGATSLAVIEGKIKSFDLDKMKISFEDSELLGSEPLILKSDTVCYLGNEKTNIASIRGGTKFETKDEISFDHLKAGDYVKFNYSIKDGKFWAVRIVLVSQYQEME